MSAARKQHNHPSEGQYSDAEIIRALTEKGAGASAVIEHLYTTIRPILASRFISGDHAEEDSWDVFQEGLLVLIQNLREGKFGGKSSIRTYLLGICKYIWLDQLKKRQTAYHNAPLIVKEQNSEAESFLPLLLQEETRITVLRLFEKLPEACRQILRMFYWNQFDLNSIASRLGYENEGSVRSRKYRCQIALMDYLRKNPEILDFFK